MPFDSSWRHDASKAAKGAPHMHIVVCICSNAPHFFELPHHATSQWHMYCFLMFMPMSLFSRVLSAKAADLHSIAYPGVLPSGPTHGWHSTGQAFWVKSCLDDMPRRGGLRKIRFFRRHNVWFLFLQLVVAFQKWALVGIIPDDASSFNLADATFACPSHTTHSHS